MKLLHVRHATSILNYGGLRILIDPVFADKESQPAIPLTPNRRKNPLVDLTSAMDILLDVDVILSTHLHRDHFDEKAKELLDKNLPVICQDNDTESLRTSGFLNIIPVTDTIKYNNITITRIEAQHGPCPIGKAMGPASGYVLEAENEPNIYITGDTIYNDTIKDTIIKFMPEILIINAGSPKFLYSERIVMNIIDLENTLKVNSELTFVIVHLDTFNHCIETRKDIHEYFSRKKLEDLRVRRFYVPQDNEWLNFEIN